MIHATPEEINTHVGRMVKMVRRAKGVDAVDLSTKLCMTVHSLLAIESGRLSLRKEQEALIADYFRIGRNHFATLLIPPATLNGVIKDRLLRLQKEIRIKHRIDPPA